MRDPTRQANQLLADRKATLAQHPGDLTLAAAHPAQRRLRVTADGILDQRLQSGRQLRLQGDRTLAPATLSSESSAMNSHGEVSRDLIGLSADEGRCLV